MRKIRYGMVCLAACFLMGCSGQIKEGISYLEEEKWEEAISSFEEEIKKDKHLDEAYRGIGIAKFELGEYEEAIENLEMALQHEAEETASMYGVLGDCRFKLKEYEKALEYYEKALQLECTEELKQELLWNEIAAYEELGQWDAVKEKASLYKETYPEDTSIDKTMEFLETR